MTLNLLFSYLFPILSISQTEIYHDLMGGNMGWIIQEQQSTYVVEDVTSDYCHGTVYKRCTSLTQTGAMYKTIDVSNYHTIELSYVVSIGEANPFGCSSSTLSCDYAYAFYRCGSISGSLRVYHNVDNSGNNDNGYKTDTIPLPVWCNNINSLLIGFHVDTFDDPNEKMYIDELYVKGIQGYNPWNNPFHQIYINRLSLLSDLTLISGSAQVHTDKEFCMESNCIKLNGNTTIDIGPINGYLKKEITIQIDVNIAPVQYLESGQYLIIYYNCGTGYQEIRTYNGTEQYTSHFYFGELITLPVICMNYNGIKIRFELIKSWKNAKDVYINNMIVWAKVATINPTKYPTNIPTINPAIKPTTDYPTIIPTKYPSIIPTEFPTINPVTNMPTMIPVDSPTDKPTLITKIPTMIPSKYPTKYPSNVPSFNPTKISTQIPSNTPTVLPTIIPSKIPSVIPSKVPTDNSGQPTISPTNIIMVTTDIKTTDMVTTNIATTNVVGNPNGEGLRGKASKLVIILAIGGVFLLILCVIIILIIILVKKSNKKMRKSLAKQNSLNNDNIQMTINNNGKTENHFKIASASTMLSTDTNLVFGESPDSNPSMITPNGDVNDRGNAYKQNMMQKVSYFIDENNNDTGNHLYHNNSDDKLEGIGSVTQGNTLEMIDDDSNFSYRSHDALTIQSKPKSKSITNGGILNDNNNNNNKQLNIEDEIYMAEMVAENREINDNKKMFKKIDMDQQDNMFGQSLKNHMNAAKYLEGDIVDAINDDKIFSTPE